MAGLSSLYNNCDMGRDEVSVLKVEVVVHWCFMVLV